MHTAEPTGRKGPRAADTEKWPKSVGKIENRHSHRHRHGATPAGIGGSPSMAGCRIFGVGWMAGWLAALLASSLCKCLATCSVGADFRPCVTVVGQLVEGGAAEVLAQGGNKSSRRRK